jgi:hypothetical protein
MAERLRISLKRGSAMTVNRIALNDERLVYAICANKKLQYLHGRTPIAYFGTTEKGVERIAQSAAARADDILDIHGVNSFDVRIVTCRPRQGIKSWKLLERALLLGFRAQFGEVPRCNSQGKNIQERNEFDVFARDRIRQIINDLTEHGQADTRQVNA